MTPDFSMTFADLRLRLAERVGLVQQDAAQRVIARTSEPDRTRLDNAVNDGIREFMAFSGPVLINGRPMAFDGWEWSKAKFSITLAKEAGGSAAGQDPSLVLLPAFMASRPTAGVSYRRSDTGLLGGKMDLRHPSDIAQRHATDSVAIGSPTYGCVTFNPANRSGLHNRGSWELRVWPKPDADYTVEFEARVQPIPFSNDGERGLWPEIHDLTIVACSVYCFNLADKPSGDVAVRQAREEMGRRLDLSAQRDISDYRNLTGNSLHVDGGTGRPYRIVDGSGTLIKAGVAYA